MTPFEPVHPEAQPSALLANIDAETAVVASMFIDAEAIHEARRLLRDGAAFVDRTHRVAYRAMLALVDQGEIVDPFTLSDAMAREGLAIGDAKLYAMELMDAIPTAANVAYYARQVREAADRRELRQLGRDLATLAESREQTVAAIAAGATARLLPVAADMSKGGFVRMADLIYPTFEGIEARGRGEGPTGVRTGYPEIDDRTFGYLEGELVLVVGVPGSGKTAWALNMFANMAVDDAVPVAFVSAEMAKEAVVQRCAGAMAAVEGKRLRAGALSRDEWERMAWAGSLLARSPFWVDDTPTPMLDDTLAKCRLLKAQHPTLRVIGVDFIQLLQLQHESGTDTEAILLRRCSYALKALARQLHLTVVATCQPNDKEIEKRDDKRPQLRDLQGSSGMRQAADFIHLIFREQMYRPESLDLLEVTTGKNRELEPFRAMLEWRGATMKVGSQGRDRLDAERARRFPRQTRLNLERGVA
jgi:replicative DNA helicase